MWVWPDDLKEEVSVLLEGLRWDLPGCTFELSVYLRAPSRDPERMDCALTYPLNLFYWLLLPTMFLIWPVPWV